ncbi:hypothetical protein QF004_001188 [Chryseobacterium sp. MDT2-18]|uniref:Uncharacterized protein n=1 Tax=Chryseobacterium salivictor TaxID=2547600 RepID=A0A4P6ZDH6_9FLAO|nr:hypothetical protein [Chryseobacterium sp. MDT2-18]QBO57581.1 hypothetical protein NBC122_00746 [Chryseobacterium salivictor]
MFAFTKKNYNAKIPKDYIYKTLFLSLFLSS